MLKRAEWILVAAQQAALRGRVARLLVAHGYRVEIASSEKTARQLLGNGGFAAAVVAPAALTAREVDLLREVQGAVRKLVVIADDARHIRRFAASFPQVHVGAADSLDEDKLLAFLADLNSPQVAIVESAGASEHLQFAGCTLDVTGRVFLDTAQHEVPLTRGEFALLVAFARNCGRVLSRAQLRNAMDGGSAESYDRSIDMLVARLRRKIEPKPAEPQFIMTVPGVGYKFVPQVRRAESAIAAPSASQDPGQVPGAGEAPRAERRQVTVLSCQILGFAALAAKLDPEDLDSAIGPAYAACGEVIARFGGTMIRTLADSVLAYFGYPKAHENDAPRAVQAALELLRALRAIEAAPIGNFRARIGVATGLMLVGELRSMGARDAGGIGEALNSALHMQKAALVDRVVIAAGTRSLVGRLFECREIAPVEMEVGSKPAPAWHVVDEIAGLPRFDALRRDDMLDFVGRDAEIERLRQCWSKALGGSGQVVLLTGEAGIGKSRLAVELQERLYGHPHAVIRYSGSPHCADAPMSALIDELQRSAGFATGDEAARKVEKLQGQFAAHGGDAAEATALACMLLGLPFDASPQVSQLSPQRRKERTFAALLARIETLAARQPVFAVLEDAHWVDPTSLEFFALLVERASAMRLLLAIVARPEFDQPWPEYSHLTTLALPRLSRADSALLIEEVAGKRRIPAAVEADIIARADGVPLFVEELAKSVLEKSANGGNGGALGSSTAATAPIPSTLHGLLLARFDRLDCGKAVAQAGAVIGREFPFELLRLVAGLHEAELRAALDQLVASGLVFRRGAPPQATYVFKHALVRDAAYDMLVRERRRMLHGGVAQSYEENFPETAETQPELLAYHHAEAGNPVKAIAYLISAAERALARSASTEALSHLTSARNLISDLSDKKGRWQSELKLEITLGRALIANRGYTAPETRDAYQRAQTLCDALDDRSLWPLITHGRWVIARTAADYSLALDQARKLQSWGGDKQDPVSSAVGHLLVGITLTLTGMPAHALPHLERAIAINRFALPGRQPFLASEADGRITSFAYLHHCLLLLGWPARARAAAGRATAELPTQLYSAAMARSHVCSIHLFERAPQKVGFVSSQLLQLAEEQGYYYFKSTGMVYRGWAMVHEGSVEEGIKICRGGIAELRAIGADCWMPRHLAQLAECHEQAGQIDEALAALNEALETIERKGERVWEAEIHRLKGRLLLKLGNGKAHEARASLTRALDVAATQRARLFELRAATSLAGLLLREGAGSDARRVLTPVYSSFTEDLEFPDLQHAKALLDTLA